MAGLNRVVLIGRFARDPELKKTTFGASVVSFTIAIDNLTKDKSTSFIPCTCWNKTAENVAKYCTKGSLVGVDGRLHQRSYDDKNGSKRSVVEVVAESVQFLDKKDANKENTESYQPADNGTDSDQVVTHEGIDSSDDDLPF